MSLFSEVKPQWDNVGVEPSGAKKTAGWLLNEKPPAEWFNWLFNRNYKCIDELRTVVDALAVSSGAANTVVYGASATGNDSYVITPNPAIIAYNAGMVVEMYADVGNAAGATINVSAKGVKTIKKITNAGKVAIDTGDMIATGVYTLVYDGTDFILINPTGIWAGLTNIMQGDKQIFTSSGTFTAPKTGIYKVICTAGGGSGGNGGIGSGGGGAGGTAVRFVSLTKGNTVAVTVGTAGVLPANDTAGNAGGSSSFGTHCSSTGGNGGSFRAANGSGEIAGGTGGTSSGSDINLSGGNGNPGYSVSYNGSYFCGLGGSSYWGGSNPSYLTSYGAGGKGNYSSGAGGIVTVEW